MTLNHDIVDQCYVGRKQFVPEMSDMLAHARVQRTHSDVLGLYIRKKRKDSLLRVIRL